VFHRNHRIGEGISNWSPRFSYRQGTPQEFNKWKMKKEKRKLKNQMENVQCRMGNALDE